MLSACNTRNLRKHFAKREERGRERSGEERGRREKEEEGGGIEERGSRREERRDGESAKASNLCRPPTYQTLILFNDNKTHRRVVSQRERRERGRGEVLGVVVLVLPWRG